MCCHGINGMAYEMGHYTRHESCENRDNYANFLENMNEHFLLLLMAVIPWAPSGIRIRLTRLQLVFLKFERCVNVMGSRSWPEYCKGSGDLSEEDSAFASVFRPACIVPFCRYLIC